MKRAATIALMLLLSGSATLALAQTGGLPTGNMPMGGMPMGGMPSGDMSNMTPEQAEAMAEQMMLRFGGMMGLDPEALRDASPEEREEMLRGGADAMAGQTMQRMEQIFGMPVEEMQNLSPEEKAALRARMMARTGPPIMTPPADLQPLRPAPRRGFPDGSIPLPVAADYSTELAVADPADRDLLLVAVDLPAREIVWRETLTTPFEKHLNLLDIAPDPSVLILELIDPETRRVIRRYRPVAAAE